MSMRFIELVVIPFLSLVPPVNDRSPEKTSRLLLDKNREFGEAIKSSFGEEFKFQLGKTTICGQVIEIDPDIAIDFQKRVMVRFNCHIAETNIVLIKKEL